MIYNMIAGDLIRFAIISAIFLVSFSQGPFAGSHQFQVTLHLIVFYFVGKDIHSKQLLPVNVTDRCDISGYDIFTYSSYLETFVTLFRASMGGYDVCYRRRIRTLVVI